MPSIAPITVVVSAVECDRAAPCRSRGGGGSRDGECRYQVAWVINPHMRVGTVDFARAQRQHAQLVGAFIAEGANVVEIPFVHGAFDSVFAKDPALLFQTASGRRALLASQTHAERRVEQRARAAWFESLEYEVIAAPEVAWEGGDIALAPPGDLLLFGVGPRSDARAAPWLEKHSGCAVIPLELVDPHFFHLDTALGVLPDGTVLAYEGAFSRDSYRRLEQVIGTGGLRELVRVEREDALNFALNLVTIGNAVLCGAHVPNVQRILRERGFRPIVTPLDEFHRSGGSAACLATRVHRDPSEARSRLGPRDAPDASGAAPPSQRSPSSAGISRASAPDLAPPSQ